MERFLRWPLFIGHVKSIARGKHWYQRSVFFVFLVLFGSPIAVGILSFRAGLAMPQPASLLTAISILAGGSLTAFTHISTLRLRLTDREGSYLLTEDAERKSIDEAATHLLMSVVASVLVAAVIVLAMNVTPLNAAGALPPLPRVFTAVILALSTYVGLLYLIAVPRLYTAYLAINRVSRELAGNLKRL